MIGTGEVSPTLMTLLYQAIAVKNDDLTQLISSIA